MTEFAPPLFSTKVHSGRRTFFFDVKKTKEEKPFVKITESSISKEGEKKRSYMTIFDSELVDFKNAVDQLVNFVQNKEK